MPRLRCGGALTTVSREQRKRRVYFYGCLTNWKRGAAICRNDLILPMARVDDAVLRALGGDTLQPAVVRAILDAVFAQLVPAHVEARVDDLRHQLRAVETKMGHLSAAIEQGGSLPPLIALLSARQQEKDALIAEIAAAETLHQLQVDRAAIEAKVQGFIAEWRTLLTGEVEDGRQLLREVLEGPLRFTPEGAQYRFRGRVAVGRVIAGAVLPTCVASPAGPNAMLDVGRIELEGWLDAA